VNGAELGDLQDKLLQILEKGQSRLAEATRFCSDASLKKSRKRLKQTIGDLTRYGRRLQSRAARTTLDPTLRESLLTDGQAIAGDVTVLRTAVRCRDDAIDQARARPAS